MTHQHRARRSTDLNRLLLKLYGQTLRLPDAVTFGPQRFITWAVPGTCTIELSPLQPFILTSFRSYYSAGTANTFDNQHLHVLKGSSNIIWDSTWTYACGWLRLYMGPYVLTGPHIARVTIPNRDVWSIDGQCLSVSRVLSPRWTLSQVHCSCITRVPI